VGGHTGRRSREHFGSLDMVPPSEESGQNVQSAGDSPGVVDCQPHAYFVPVLRYREAGRQMQTKVAMREIGDAQVHSWEGSEIS
jgi:hypothetical protein